MKNIANFKDILNTKKNELQKIEIIILYFSYTIYVMNFMFLYVYIISDIVSWINKVTKCLLALIVIKDIIELKKEDIKKTILTVVILIIFAISSIVCETKHLLYLVMFIIAFKNIELNKFIKYDFIFKSISIVMILICYCMNFTDVYIMENENRVTRYSMGFSHPNIFAIYLVSTFFEYIYLRREKNGIKDIVKYVVIMTILFFVINYFANSRTSLIMLILLIAFIVFDKVFNNIKIKDKIVKLFTKKKILKKVLKIVITNLFVILSLCSFFVGYLYSNQYDIAYKINSLTSSRVRYISNFMNEYNISLFGNKIETVSTRESKETGEEAAVLDNGYVCIVLEYGIIVFIFMCVFSQKFLAYYINKKEKMIVAIMIIFLLSGFMENYFFLLHYNVFLLFFSEIFYGAKKSEDVQEVEESGCEEKEISNSNVKVL